jgi:serine/threonine protein kinase
LEFKSSSELYFILGIHNIHKEKAVHRDIKPVNILVDKKGTAFVADLGGAKHFDNTAQFKGPKVLTSVLGTTDWMAPEILLIYQGQVVSNLDILKGDIFSLGFVSLNCLDNEFLETADTKNLNMNPIKLFQYLRTFISGEIKREKIDLGFYYMLRCMLSYDIHTRPSVEEVYEDTLKFISQIEVRGLENYGKKMEKTV